MEKVLENLDHLLNEGESGSDASESSEGEGRQQQTADAASPRRMVLTEEMLVEVPEEDASPEALDDNTSVDSGEFPEKTQAGQVSPVEAAFAEDESEGDAGTDQSESELAVETPSPEATIQQDDQAPERTLDVDVLFGVMEQVSADVTARIGEALPGMIEEALNRHLSGLKNDRHD